ncbi:MAG TPA: hypothetical protein VGM83_14895 [Devosiaceae bacterium]|jgi:hypothetical protein
MTGALTTAGLHPDARRAQGELRRIALVAVLAIGLGLVMQVLIVISRMLAGAGFPGIVGLAETAQSVTWAFFVCTGVAIGVSIGKARKALAGLVGFLFAPIALAAAKAAQKAVLVAIDAAERQALLPVTTLGLVRAIEYGLLAWLLTVLAEREVARPLPYLGIGTVIGLIFGITLALLTRASVLASGAELTAPQLAGTLVNEIGSPIGCAFLIFIGQAVAKNFKIYKEHTGAGSAA